jgi:ribonucleotide monophosphatase NagD (HAD superfamily)
MIEVKVVIVYNKRHGTVNVYVRGLEKVFEILEKYGFERGDEENGVLWWFGYPEDVDMEKFIDELRRINVSVEYVEEQ